MKNSLSRKTAAIISLWLILCLSLATTTFPQQARVTHREPGESITKTHPGLLQASLIKQAKQRKITAKTLSPLACLNDAYVNAASGNDANAGDTPANAKLTIQAGIDAVCAGGTVHVYPGSYSETATGRFVLGANGPHQFGLFIDKGIIIQGVDGGGTPITDYSNVLAEVETNATNNFGASGIFVEGDGVTIQGLKILPNAPGDNKTIEIIGDNFTLKYCHVDVAGGGSVYFNDWQFDSGTNTSHVKSYTIKANFIDKSASIDLTSGAGFSGPVSGRVIKDNKFVNSEFWPSISFNGSGTGVPWFVYSVGGAVIEGNDFTNTYNTADVTSGHIRSRGTVDNSQFDWHSYWNNNSFNKAVVTVASAPFDVRSYTYPGFYGTYTDVRRIGVTIQGEIDNAVAGDKVLVNKGTYVENPVIEKDLTLEGAGASTTTIKAPSTIPPASDPASSVLDINGAGVQVEVSDFTVSGPGPSGCGSIGSGIFIRGGADANIHDNRILDIRDQPFSGCQNGVGIQVGRASLSTSGTATITNNVISGYQKNGITISNTGSSATITSNTVTGAGPTTIIAQNGIQVSNGATANINDNEVSDHSYTPFSFVSTGMLLFGSDANTNGNTVTENQVGIYHIEGSGTHDGNTVSASGAGTGSPGFWGIVVDDPPARRKPSPADEAVSSTPKAATNNVMSLSASSVAVTVKNCVLTGDGTAAGIGLEADAGYGVPDIDFTATNNFIKDWGYGIAFTQCPSGCTGSIFTNLKFNQNSITGNQVGVDNSSGVVADGEKNWWGSNTGPTHAGNLGGTGDPVSDDVDFDPWLCSGNDVSPSIGFQPTSSTSPCGPPPGADGECGDFVFLTDKDVVIDRPGASDGNIHANNDIVFRKGAPSTLISDLTAVDDITIQTKNTIDGVATAGDHIDLKGTADVTGGTNPNSAVTTVALPSPSFTAGSSDVTVPKNGTFTLAAGFYDDVKVQKNGTLNLSAGDYFIDVLDLQESAKLIIDVGSGPVNVNVVHKLSFGKKVVVSIIPTGEAGSDDVTFTQLKGSQLIIGQQARVLGSIIAVESAVLLSKNSRFKGSICAQEVRVDQGAAFRHHSSSTPLPSIQDDFDLQDVETEEQITSVVTDYELSANYPNPFNPSTTIKFAMPEAGRVTLRIYSLNGQLVRTLVDNEMPQGRHSISWNARNDLGTTVSSGVYFYRLDIQKADGEAAFLQTRRMTLLK